MKISSSRSSATSSFGSQTKRYSKANTQKSAWNWAVRRFLNESCAAGQGTGKRGVRYFLNPFSDS
ncbi:MAG: hypothetical protein LBJ67_03730 [Planctomycetaceae bacterium]|nr:hypothetical protein [Planctomycetaceae bacterium]